MLNIAIPEHRLELCAWLEHIVPHVTHSDLYSADRTLQRAHTLEKPVVHSIELITTCTEVKVLYREVIMPCTELMVPITTHNI